MQYLTIFRLDLVIIVNRKDLLIDSLALALALAGAFSLFMGYQDPCSTLANECEHQMRD